MTLNWVLRIIKSLNNNKWEWNGGGNAGLEVGEKEERETEDDRRHFVVKLKKKLNLLRDERNNFKNLLQSVK